MKFSRNKLDFNNQKYISETQIFIESLRYCDTLKDNQVVKDLQFRVYREKKKF